METTLANYDANKFNVLVPTQEIQQVSPWHAARIAVCTVNPDPMAGDVFKVGSRKNDATNQWEDLYTLAKPALMRLAASAGIVWNWRESDYVKLDSNYVLYRAVGALRLPDGSWQPLVGTKEIDLTVIEDELYEANLKKGREHAGGDAKAQAKLNGMSADEWAKAQTRSAMIQWRKNKAARAETGAMLRVVRAALALRSQYTVTELKKPFVVPRIDFSPDYSDPEVRKALIQNGMPAMASLFGQSAPATASQPFADSHPALTVGAEVDDQYTPDVAGPVTIIEPPNQSDPEQTNLFDGNAGAGQSETDNGPDQCTECGASIKSASVVDFSQKKYGRILCYKCQQSLKEAGVI